MRVVLEGDGLATDAVLYPTDLSQASQEAFHHALALAVRHGAHFTLLHAVGRRATDNWPGFPSVRAKLAQWRRAAGPDGGSVAPGRARVSKVELQIRDPVAASLHFVARHRVDMVVLATDGPRGLSRLIRPPRAETLARESRIFTLFIPGGGRTFVDGATGKISLDRILVPVHPRTDPQPAMLRAVHLAELVGNPALEITLLHIDDGEGEQRVDVPHLPYCRWTAVRRGGNVVEEILGAAEVMDADAIYMSSTWRKPRIGSDDGSVTEQVLAAATCPVGVVPVDGEGDR